MRISLLLFPVFILAACDVTIKPTSTESRPEKRATGIHHKAVPKNVSTPSPAPSSMPIISGSVLAIGKKGENQVDKLWIDRYRQLEKEFGEIEEDNQIQQVEPDKFTITVAIMTHYTDMVKKNMRKPDAR